MGTTESIKRHRALKQAVEELAGVAYDDVPVETSLAKHMEAAEEFCAAVAKQFPDMTNRDTTTLMALAYRTFWPGITNGFGQPFPPEAADLHVRERQAEILREQGEDEE